MTDLITLPREVVQEALDALTGADDFSPGGTPIYIQEITALRKALAAEQPKPEAQDWLITGNTFTSTPPEPYANWPAFFAEMIRTRTIRGLQIGAALAAEQPKPEPVAWLSRDEARLALWKSINSRGVENPNEDKLILDHLRQQGLWIGKVTSPAPPEDEALRRDAERYRWLRERAWFQFEFEGRYGDSGETVQELDAAIDAVMGDKR